MKFEGTVKFKRNYPGSAEFVGVVKDLPLPIRILIPGVKGLQAEGTIVIDIPREEKPKAEQPKKGKK